MIFNVKYKNIFNTNSNSESHFKLLYFLLGLCIKNDLARYFKVSFYLLVPFHYYYDFCLFAF